MIDNNLTFMKLIKSRPKSFYSYLIVFSIISSITNVGILLLVNTAFATGGSSFFGKHLPEVFLLLFIVSFFSTVFFQNHMTEFTNNLIFELEISTVKKVRASTFESFTEMGRDRVYAIISDTTILGAVPERFIAFINGIISIICSISYLFWVSAFGAAIIVGLMTMLFLIYIYRNNIIIKDIEKNREHQNKYYFYLTEMLMGFKQVQISAVRNNELFENYIVKNRSQMRELGTKSSKKFIVNQIIGTYSWYLMLGFIVFTLPSIYKMDIPEKAAFILVILYIIAPLSNLINIMSYYSTVKVAMERINQLNETLVTNPEANLKVDTNIQKFSTIRFENIKYSYKVQSGASFLLELPDFSLKSGEIVFIVGGNGSGKTTFVNLLTGLYEIQSGNIYINDQLVTQAEFRSFSNSIAVVFNDHHLFRENYDCFDLSDNNHQLKKYMTLFNMDGILKMDNEKQFFDVRLSKGQQRRLSLILALLEDKPLVVLDEWAAEQDPDNRIQFYEQWLDILKKMGKTVILVTHDDDYYELADRVVKFNYGKIVHDETRLQEY